MEYSVENLWKKIFPKKSKMEEGQTNPVEEQQTMLARKQVIEKFAKELDVRAKLNMLDAKLSKERLADHSNSLVEKGAELRGKKDMCVHGSVGQSGNFIGPDLKVGLLDEALLQKSIAEEMEEFNYQFLVESAQMSPLQKIKAFTHNSVLESASQLFLEKGGDSILVGTSQGAVQRTRQDRFHGHPARFSIAYPNTLRGDISADSIFPKVRDKLTLENMTKYFGSQAEATLFCRGLGEFDGKVALSGESMINNKAIGNAGKVYKVIVDMAESNFKEFNKNREQNNQKENNNHG